MYKSTNKILYYQPIINNIKTFKKLQSKLTFNSFNECENNDLSNITDNNKTENNISNAPYSVAIGDIQSNNISKIQYVLLQQYIIK